MGSPASKTWDTNTSNMRLAANMFAKLLFLALLVCSLDALEQTGPDHEVAVEEEIVPEAPLSSIQPNLITTADDEEELDQMLIGRRRSSWNYRNSDGTVRRLDVRFCKFCQQCPMSASDAQRISVKETSAFLGFLASMKGRRRGSFHGRRLMESKGTEEEAAPPPPDETEIDSDDVSMDEDDEDSDSSDDDEEEANDEEGANELISRSYRRRAGWSRKWILKARRRRMGGTKFCGFCQNTNARDFAGTSATDKCDRLEVMCAMPYNSPKRKWFQGLSDQEAKKTMS